MLILLPPSEGKAAPDRGDPVDLASLWLPALTPARRRVLTRLVALCRRTGGRAAEAARQALGLSAGQHDELARNAALVEAPAAPAAEVYRGVLYEALDAASLAPQARAWLDGRVVVMSALWGAVRLTDRIPAYRCAAGTRLPVLGGLAGYWRRALTPALDRAASTGPVLDLRSSAYAGMWRPTGATAERTATVRVLHERLVDGVPRRSVVSHFNKATKGRLARQLALAGAQAAAVPDVVAALRELGYAVQEHPAPAGTPRRLDVVVAQL